MLLLFFIVSLCIFCGDGQGFSDLAHTYTILKKADGLYHDPIKARNYPQTVLVTAFNTAYFNHFHNFKCFVDRLGLKILVVGLDLNVVTYMENEVPDVYATYWQGASNSEMADMSIFRSKEFNKISVQKMEIVYHLIQMGYNVLFSDVDVLMIKDPIPHMIHSNIDYSFGYNQKCVFPTGAKARTTFEGNTGFHYIKTNSRTIALWSKFLKDVTRFDGKGKDDQWMFWTLVRSYKNINIIKDEPKHGNEPSGRCAQIASHENDDIVNMCALNHCQFTCGQVGKMYPKLTNYLKGKQWDLFTLHANFLSGSMKQDIMNNNGLWLASKNKTSGFWNGKCSVFSK